MYIDLMRNELNQVFTEGVAHDAIIVGHGDWRIDPVAQHASVDRQLQLTPVRTISL
jgi:hypothetical protein